MQHPASPACLPHALDVFVSPNDEHCSQHMYDLMVSPSALEFVAALAETFHDDVQQLHARRQARRVATEQHGARPHFRQDTRSIRHDASWRIESPPQALMDRRVDIGDVSPANATLLLRALNSGAQGVQVDFDDGHCPTWKNTIQGHFHVFQAARGLLEASGERVVANPALLLVRPRAWNMDEQHMIVNGHVVAGPLFDFGLHLFHNGRYLLDHGTGPFLYLSKLEAHTEATLWRNIFEYTEEKLQLPHGSIKATVLIENIFAAFEMDEILYELRHHSSGLNCGMWDYTASILVTFRHRSECVLPDREEYVSMKSDFLRYYLDLLVFTCQRRHAPATAGMVPFVLAKLPLSLSASEAITKAQAGKRIEAVGGCDGALVFDVALVPHVAEVFALGNENKAMKIQTTRLDETVLRDKLLTLPRGNVTLQSVKTNVRIALLYVLYWLSGYGIVVVNGCVEDSATAEISRAQLWQWVYHRVPIAGTSNNVNATLIEDMLRQVSNEATQEPRHPLENLVAARNIVFHLSTTRFPPTFITTYLQERVALL